MAEIHETLSAKTPSPAATRKIRRAPISPPAAGILSRCPGPVRDRLAGPGGLYNAGNAIALVAGLTLKLLEVHGEASASAAVRAYFFGSPGATWLTVAILIFLVSGEVYHRAWSNGGADRRLVRRADYLSSVGAAALTVSLMYYGDLLLAFVAGTLLFGGKLGNAVARSGSWPIRFEIQFPFDVTRTINFDVFRVSVVLSRFPSLAALSVEIRRIIQGGAPFMDALLPTIMILCFLIWLRADLMLMRMEQRLAQDMGGA